VIKLSRTGELAMLIATVDDVAERIGRLPESRLRARAASGLELAQELADAAAGIEARAAANPPPPREVPALSLFAVGDQVAVTGADLLAAADGLAGTTAVWHRGEQCPLTELLAHLQACADAVRAVL
jgi:hypothetical protein